MLPLGATGCIDAASLHIFRTAVTGFSPFFSGICTARMRSEHVAGAQKQPSAESASAWSRRSEPVGEVQPARDDGGGRVRQVGIARQKRLKLVDPVHRYQIEQVAARLPGPIAR